MRRTAFVLLALLLAPLARAGGPDAKVLEDGGKWESGYGSKFYNVVGRLKNTSDHPLQFVKLRIELLDEAGKVVASTETWNEEAEVLGVPEADGTALLAQGKIKPIPAGTEQRFRGSFLDEETPPFKSYRVLVIETPAAK
jgi:hypothetical protein